MVHEFHTVQVVLSFHLLQMKILPLLIPPTKICQHLKKKKRYSHKDYLKNKEPRII